MKPRISYLIALYNKEKYINECIDSILADTDESYEIEICIVDDGSTDKSLSTAKSSYRNLKLVKIHGFNENKGKVAAYNKAFELCTGDFISIFGADDTIIKGRNKALISACQETKCIVYGGFLKYETGTDPKKGIIFQQPENPNYLSNLLGNSLSGGCFMAPKKIMDGVFPIPEELKFEDWWISNITLKNKQAKTIKALVSNYRIHESNDCGAIESSLKSIQNDYKRHFNYLNRMKGETNNKVERSYIERALAIRKLVCDEKIPYGTLIKPPYNKSYLTMLTLFLFGNKIIDLKKQIFKRKR